MELIFTPEEEARLSALAARDNLSIEQLAKEVVVDYLAQFSGTKSLLDSRYDEVKNGKVNLIDGEAFFEALKEYEEKLTMSRVP